MAEKIVRVCDVCEAEGATLFKIQEDGEKLTIDLCDIHAKPIRGAVRGARGSSGASTPRRNAKPSKAPSRASNRSRGVTITSMDEVKAQIADPFKTP